MRTVWMIGVRVQGLAAYGLQVEAFEKVISSLSCSRKNSRPEKINERGNERKQITVSDTDRTDATSYALRNERKENARSEMYGNEEAANL